MTTSTCFGLKSSWLTFLHYKKNEEKNPCGKWKWSDQNEVTLPENLVWHTIICRSGRDPDLITNIASKSHSYWLPCGKKQTSFFRGRHVLPSNQNYFSSFFFVFERIRIGRIAAIYIHDMLSDKQLFVLELDECSFN